MLIKRKSSTDNGFPNPTFFIDDGVSGVTFDRPGWNGFLKLSADYEAEQKELTEQVKTWRQAVETFEQDQANFNSFAAIVRKYVGIRELTPTIVNETVERQRKGRTA